MALDGVRQNKPPQPGAGLTTGWLLGLFVSSRAAAPLTILIEFKLVGRCALVLVGVVVTSLAFLAFERN